MKTPVTLITGFLGAGKTTLVNALLNQTDEKIALIINEFGDVSIDHRLIKKETEEMIELASGSICCAVKDDLMQVLASLMLERNFDRVIIETTGLADPIPLIEAFAKQQLLTKQYKLPQTITVVDAFHIAEQLQLHEEAIPQIALADKIIINKIDLVDEIESIEELIHRINPVAQIIHASQSNVPVDEILTDKIEVRPLEEKTHISHEAHGGHHEHSSNIETLVVTEERPLDLQKIGLFIAEQILVNPDGFVRYKGILNIAGMEERFVFQGVHTQFNNTKDRPWHENEERLSEVVLIGRELDEEALTQALRDCVA